jgi:2-oxoglutarate ferredoxin oxidoreductase subunit gamma
MKQRTNSKSEVMIAGIGGMGVLVAGQVLAWTALEKYKYVSYVPSYEAARRGGLSECTTVFSDVEIASPILDQVETIILLDGPQLKSFEGRVRPGGVVIIESAGLEDKPERDDYRLLPFSGLNIAISMGDSRVNSLILLGVYVELSKSIPAKLIEAELDRRFGHEEEHRRRNREAFSRGLELAKSAGL